MSFKLTKREDAELSSHVSALRESFGELEKAAAAYNGRLEEIGSELEDAVAAYNAALEDIKGELSVAVDEHNQRLADALEFASGVAELAREAWEARSEKWRRGAAGEAASGFVEAWDDLVGELGQDVEFDLPDPVEFEAPDGVDIFEVADHADLLENAPAGAE